MANATTASPAMMAARRFGAHRAEAAVRLHHHGVRDVHVDPGHPDRLGVLERNPGRPVGELERGLLGPDRLSDRRSDRDPAVGIFVARLRHAAAVCDLGGRLHDFEPALRLRHDHRGDDPLARAPGLSRRRHDPDGVRLGLHRVPALEIPHRRSHHRACCDPGADDRPDGRRLHHRFDVVELAVLHQRRARHRHHPRRAGAGRFRRAEFRAARPLRLVGPDLHGRLPRHAGICAGGRPAI